MNADAIRDLNHVPFAAAANVATITMMSTVAEIERAVERLSTDELRAFRVWFAERDAAEWDRQFEADATAGRLDSLADEALRDLRGGRCRKL